MFLASTIFNIPASSYIFHQQMAIMFTGPITNPLSDGKTCHFLWHAGILVVLPQVALRHINCTSLNKILWRHKFASEVTRGTSPALKKFPKKSDFSEHSHTSSYHGYYYGRVQMFATRLKYTTHLEQKKIVNFSSFLLFYSHLHLIGWNPKIS